MQYRPEIEISAEAKKKIVKAVKWVIAIFAFIIVGSASIHVYTDYLWYSEDARHPEVFTTPYGVRGTLFTIGFACTLAFVYFNLRIALRSTQVYLRTPQTPAELIASKTLGFISEQGTFFAKLAATIVALLAGLSLAGDWNSYLLWRHPQLFNVKDPIFGLDVSYFVFHLPFQISLVNFAFGVYLTTMVLTGLAYGAVNGMAAAANVEFSKPAIRTHLSVLFGIGFLLLGAQLWLGRMQFGLLDTGQFTGAGYAAMTKLSAQTALAVLLFVFGLASFASVRVGKAFSIPAVGGIICFLFYLIGLEVVPGIVQAVSVTPNKLAAESPYATKAINMTRFAYGLDSIVVKDQDVSAQPSAEDVKNASSTFDNMRLWDPTIMRDTFTAIQGLRTYYDFPDVDVDRYTINGKQQLVMLAARDMNQAGLTTKSWVYQHLQYTHGFGIVMSPVNGATEIGQPNFLIRDLPPTTPPEIPIAEPRIYFSDRPPAPEASEDYVIVHTKVQEFDYPSEHDDRYSSWKGNRGVRLGNGLAKLAFAAMLGDGNMLISSNVTGDSRLLYRRNVRDRAQFLFPFLSFDSDPYIVALNGKLLWVLDGYTTTDQMPYSAKDEPGNGFNYIRNPIKVTVDAYTGETIGYAIDDNEPLLRAYRAIYPNLIKGQSEIPAGLREHFRYPDDLFTAQAKQLKQYHVTNPVAFLNGDDAWDMPTEKGLTGEEDFMKPYYVQFRLPGEPKDEFFLILPFTPKAKGNMSGWMAVHCDPDDYGKMMLYRYPKGSNLAGPKQEEARFNQDDAIANLNRQLNNDQSTLITGNLLVMPVGNSVVYVEPMFLESRGIQAIPALRKVILALQDRIVVADTYSEALAKLFGAGASPTQPVTPTGKPTAPNPVTGTVPKAALADVLKLADDAEAALRAGDFAKYGELQKQLRAKLEQLSK